MQFEAASMKVLSKDFEIHVLQLERKAHTKEFQILEWQVFENRSRLKSLKLKAKMLKSDTSHAGQISVIFSAEKLKTKKLKSHFRIHPSQDSKFSLQYSISDS